MIDARFILERGAFRLEVELKSNAPVVAIAGPSGAGKTSVLNAISGLLRPASGEIRIDGMVYDRPEAGIHLPPHRRRIGYVFQDNRLFPHLSVEENLLAGWHRLRPAERRIRFQDVVELSGLGPLLGRFPTTLSGGEQRRVGIGRALLTSPRLLILDEPLAGLDRQLRDSLLAYLMKLPQCLDVQMLYVSHTLGDLLALARDAAVIRDGRLRLLAAPEQLLDAGANGVTETVEAGLAGTVVGPAADPGFLCVVVGGDRITVRGPACPAGTPVRLLVPAHHVMLALPPLPALSVRNRLPARVAALHGDGGQVIASLDVAGQRLFADITPDAVRELALRPGVPVIACFKAQAVRLSM